MIIDKTKIPESVIKYSDYLKNLYPNLKQVYVFGSCAKENMKPDSDIDMAFIFQDISDTFDIQVRLIDIIGNKVFTAKTQRTQRKTF
ncbi:Nucleotidyltransferase domain-containing protein [Desulfonema limicola]|uniref:Nucleotidyltransferase domain-containing protein n=1 Tax=Desulfonema limicola TaxID=45656 RepID=A0A975GJB1_9BACT|nr:Nucleotidyltransferase domain-containing protein [Desulfonema limicola]